MKALEQLDPPEMEGGEEQVSQKKSLEWLRTGTHSLGISSIAMIFVSLQDYPVLLAVGLLGGLFILLNYDSIRAYQGVTIRPVKAWGRFIFFLLGWLYEWGVSQMRAHQEMHTRATATDFTMALGICFILWSFQLMSIKVLATAILIVAWSDPPARIVGIRFGKRRWPFMKKTFLGSFTCALVGAGICFSVFRLYWLAVIVGLVAMFAELIEQKIIHLRSSVVLLWLFGASGRDSFVAFFGDELITPADNATILLATSLTMELFVS